MPLRAVLTALTATLEATPQPVVIFLDDLHRLGRDAVQDVLTRLVHEAPPTVRFVFSGRDLSMLPRADLRTRGELLEIGAEQLRFGRDESQSLLPLLSQGAARPDPRAHRRLAGRAAARAPLAAGEAGALVVARRLLGPHHGGRPST